MTSILLTVSGAMASASVTGPLTSGMVGIPVTIKYDDAWDGLTKNLMCRCGEWGSIDGELRTILNVKDAATVAHEVMKAGMPLYLGLEGFSPDGKLVIPTTWARCEDKIQIGANTGTDLSANPTLPVWNQLQTEIEQLQEQTITQEQIAEIQTYAQDARQAAEEAKQAAASAGGGLYYTPVVTQPTDNTLKFEFKPSVTGAPIPTPVTVELPGGDSFLGEALTTAQINALDGMFKVCAYIMDDVSAEYTAFQTAFGLAGSGDSGGDTTEKTLTGISAVYSGGSVPVGTAVTALTGVVVTAHYSDGSAATVTGYTLSGTIAEGSNTITVTYQGKTATFTVTGVSDSGGTGGDVAVNLFDKSTMSVAGKVVGNSDNIISQSEGKMAKIPIAAGTTYAVSKTGSVWINYQVGNVMFVDDSETVVDSFAFGAPSSIAPVEGTYYPPNISESKDSKNGLTTAYLDNNNRGFTFTAPDGATYMYLTLCWNGTMDSTDTLMFEVGDTCHDYVAYVS